MFGNDASIYIHIKHNYNFHREHESNLQIYINFLSRMHKLFLIITGRCACTMSRIWLFLDQYRMSGQFAGYPVNIANRISGPSINENNHCYRMETNCPVLFCLMLTCKCSARKILYIASRPTDSPIWFYPVLHEFKNSYSAYLFSQ